MKTSKFIRAAALTVALAETVNLSYEIGRNAVWCEDEKCSVVEYTFGMGQTVDEWLGEYTIGGKVLKAVRKSMIMEAMESAKVYLEEDLILVEVDGELYEF